jgi:hypothetical protein
MISAGEVSVVNAALAKLMAAGRLDTRRLPRLN